MNMRHEEETLNLSEAMELSARPRGHLPSKPMKGKHKQRPHGLNHLQLGLVLLTGVNIPNGSILLCYFIVMCTSLFLVNV